MPVLDNIRIRAAVKYLIAFILIPAMAVAGSVAFDEKRHIFISLAVAVLALLVFFTGYDKRQVGTRRMVITAIMTALCLIGRFIPVIKPMTALIILTGMYLGCEAGFLTGALTALISNFWFGQGPWTAFMMLALGLIGFAAGLISGVLMKKKAVLIVFGAVCGAAYSMIMDIWTVLWYAEGFSFKLYAAASGTSVPYLLSYVISNAVFLYLLGKPVGDKLMRVKIKYGV